MRYIVKILAMRDETHDVKRFILEKPAGFSFVPGHSMLIAINKPGLEEERREFSMTSVNDDKVLEFTIKRYDEHDGITKKLHALEPGDELIISDMFGSVRYKNQGVWIAGGAGITPFLAIFRQLHKENKIENNVLFFSNKEHRDIICERELKLIFGKNAVFTLTREKKEDYEFGRINQEMLKRYTFSFDKDFYVCGPDAFVHEMKQALAVLKATAQIVEF